MGEGTNIERFAPELDHIIELLQPIEELPEGLGAPPGEAEGLLLRGGITRDRKGCLVTCERENRRVTRQEPDGSITTIASSFQGRTLNQPRDVVVKSDDYIYFTDPPGVYRVTPDLGTVTLLIDDFTDPNGLAFSPDETVLYINDARRIRAFNVAPNGTVARNTERVLVDLGGEEPAVFDGMKVDVNGNVYCGATRGLWIIDSTGKKLGRIVHGMPATTKLAFGGTDSKTLYFTIGDHLGRVKVKLPGTGHPLFPSFGLEGDPGGRKKPG